MLQENTAATHLTSHHLPLLLSVQQQQAAEPILRTTEKTSMRHETRRVGHGFASLRQSTTVIAVTE
jgi:hypothetical protein